MPRLTGRNITAFIGVFLLVWLGLRYVLPIGIPFLLGGLLALAAEPAVRFLEKRLRLPRIAASGIGVSVTLVLLSCLLVLLTALLVRELGLLARALPDLEESAVQGLSSLESFLIDLTSRTPDRIRPILRETVSGLFSNGTALVDQLVRRIPGVASAVLGHVPGSFLTVGTGILSGFMISARFTQIKAWLQTRLAATRLSRYLPALRRMRSAIGGWLKAQLKLSSLSFLIVLAGLILLQVPYAPIWALLTAVVDAIPILGTGTVLLPWCLVSLLQGEHVRSVGLLGTYVVAMLSRTVMEPRLVGKQLGLDPLMTLIALYTGYQIWGIGGMLLAPVLCVAAMELAKAKP